MRSPRQTTTLIASMMLGAALALTGCGGEADPPPPVAPGESTAAQSPDTCGGVGDLVKNHLNSAKVTSVVVNGQCTSVVVHTSLGDDDATALALCESAAEVAYTGDVNAVTVLAASGDELAIGISGAKCIA